MARSFDPTAAGIAKLLAYSNNILGSVQSGGNVQDIWAAVRAGVAAGGGSIEGASIFDMNFVAGNAREINSAQIAVSKAQPGQAVDSTMWAWAPWSARDTAAQLDPSYLLRYQYEVQHADGSLHTLWGQTDWQGSLDGTVDALMERAQGSAQAALDTGSPGALAVLGDLGGAFVTGVGALQVLRV